MEEQTMETPEAQQPEQPEKARKLRKPRRQQAVIDRIEDGKWAVLLVGKKEVEKIVPIEHLPQEAKAGSWLKLRMMEEGVGDIEVDEAATAAARGRIQSKMEQLRSRNNSQLKPISANEAQASGKLKKLTPATDDSGAKSEPPSQSDAGFSQGSKEGDS